MAESNGDSLPVRPVPRRASVLVTDLDNTLWDWFAIWHASFSTLLDALVTLSGVDRSVLEAEIRAIHHSRGTSEYAHLVQEIPSLATVHPGEDLAVLYGEAIQESRVAREDAMTLYPRVLDTLNRIKAKGVRIIGYTESQAFYTSYRVRKLGLDGVIDVLYSPPDHDFPAGIDPSQLRTRSDDAYNLKLTEHRKTPDGAAKPSPTVLNTIISNESVDPSQVVYIGDKLTKDVAMAQRSGAIDVHAAYGEVIDREAYSLLQRVSHWPDVDVQNEESSRDAGTITPSIALREGFYELLNVVDFEAQ